MLTQYNSLDHFHMPPINDQHLPHPSSSKSQAHSPKFGQARCYWALLSEALQFLYVDPTFRIHLGPQAHSLIGRSFLDFVHLEERSTAHSEFRRAVSQETLHGSVTRVRYTRLNRIRASLGFTGVVATPLEEDRVSCDKDYITCDLVINLAADNLILCFIHASMNISPADNDGIYRTPWSNWCGTSAMDGEEIERLEIALSSISPSYPKKPNEIRIFQILGNTSSRENLLLWPTTHHISQDECRQLVRNVRMDTSNSSDAKTSCTRRFRALQPIPPTRDFNREVESGLIPYEQIILAFHYLKVEPRAEAFPNDDSLRFPNDYSSPNARIDRFPSENSSSIPRSDLSHNYQSFGVPNSWQSPSPSPGAQTSSFSKQHIPSGQFQNSIYADVIPSPRHRETRVYAKESSRDTYSNTTGSKGNPPAGIARCAACKSVSSPEWRKGPSGKKDLCNACGLRYSRAKAKKEGITSRRRRDNRGIQDLDMVASRGRTSDDGPTNFSLHNTQRLTMGASHSRDSFESLHSQPSTISPPPYTYAMEHRQNPMPLYSYPTTGGVTYTHPHHSNNYHHHANTPSYHDSPVGGSSTLTATGYMLHSVPNAADPPPSYVRGLSSERPDDPHAETNHHYSLH